MVCVFCMRYHGDRGNKGKRALFYYCYAYGRDETWRFFTRESLMIHTFK